MKLIEKNRKNAYVFDFDDTLVKTDAKIYIKVGDTIVNKLSSKEFATYDVKPNETLDFTEFHDDKFIDEGVATSMFGTLQNINKAIEEKRSTSIVCILSARESMMKKSIHNYFIKRNISCILKDNIITVGDSIQFYNISTAEAKRMILKAMLDDGYEITFFDDDIKNIEIAESIPGIKTRYVREDDI